jgi:hypothetical protein
MDDLLKLLYNQQNNIFCQSQNQTCLILNSPILRSVGDTKAVSAA